jgi:diguanylate cyclase
MQQHAMKLLDAPYVKKLMIQSIVGSMIIFPLLAWAKFILVDGISVGLQHFLLPLVVGFGIGYLIGKMRILSKAIQTQNVLDPLTKAFNRHWLAGYGRQQIHLSRRTGQPLSMALIEIDSFKSINDQFGNASGDVVLQQVANAIREVSDTSARLVRWSGKVFMLFLPGTESDKALEIVENVRKEIEARSADPVPKFTASIGLSCFNKEEDTELHHLVERASRAMNQASSQGMNCIRVG